MHNLLRPITKRLARLFAVFLTPVTPRDQIVEAVDAALQAAPKGAKNAVVFVARLDGLRTLTAEFSPSEMAQIGAALKKRLEDSTLSKDVIIQLEDSQFAISLNPLRHIDAEDALMLAGQIQNVIAVPIAQGDLRAKVTASIGCAIAQTARLSTAHALVDAAEIALAEAANKGPAALRLYGPEMGARARTRKILSADAKMALASGAIHAYFQPQICLKTRAVSGCEALARWQHDQLGLVHPADFLPVLEDAGLMRVLCQVILQDALRMLTTWDEADLKVPSVSVNMCADSLRAPELFGHIQAQLAQMALTPDRLVIEVLETVGARDENDPIIANLHALSQLGCKIDLDDYGTGQTSIKSVRSFAIDRIKIDRSYVTGIDSDCEQQQVVKTVISMAQHLAVDTLGEGVENEREIAYLSKVGCNYAQGYAIAHPLAPSEVIAWMKRYHAPSISIAQEQYAP